MTRPTLEEVLACPDLPSLPRVAMDVLEVTRDPDVGLDEIAKVIHCDPALTGRILRTVNSSYYGLSRPCPTISRAMSYLGLSSVRSLVLGFGLVDLSRTSGPGFDLLEYWRRCVHSAAAARRIASRLGTCDPEEAFTAALLQDVGMLSIHTAARSVYETILREADGDHRELPDIETRTIGFTHADAGAELGKRWNLPAQLLEPIRLHHGDRDPDPGVEPITDVVRMSCRLATALAQRIEPSRLEVALDQGRQRLDLTNDEVRSLLEGVTEDARSLSSLFTVQIGEPIEVDEILTRAEAVRAEHDRHLERGVEERGDADARHQGPAGKGDPSGRADRLGFEQELAARFGQALASKATLGLILIDVDHLRSVNETHGDAVGDAVLRTLVQRIVRGVPEHGLACRYGGEEFAVILPGADSDETSRLAERLREEVQATPLDLRGMSASEDWLQPTASFGVAAVEPAVAALITRPEILFTAAERALHAAKKGGRNCVRIFSAHITRRIA